MKNIKKKLFKLSIISTLLLVVFIIAFVAVNLFDAPEPEGIFTLTDLYPASIEPDNAYYQIMAFSYPSDIDITSADVISYIRKFSEPGILDMTAEQTRKIYKKYKNLSRKLIIKGVNKELQSVFTQNSYKDFEKIVSNKEKIKTIINSNPVLMKRYLQLLKTEKIEDFSLPTLNYPIPNFTIIKIAKLNIAKNIITAVEGNWQESVRNIFTQFNFFRKFSRNSRQMINKMVSQALMEISLKAQVFIMNQTNCPKEVFSIILDGLPLLKESEISIQKPLIFEFLSGVQTIDELLRSKELPFGNIGVISSFFPSTSDWLNFLVKFKIFLNRNRTVGFYLNEIKKILKFEKMPPFQWKQNIINLVPPDPTKGLFWWFSNPVGKVLYAVSYRSYQRTIYRKYQTQAIFDLTKKCAEYHLKFTPETQISEILKNLDNYKAIDPFSGKPYIFNEKKNILYSVGTNRIDDGGLGTMNKRNEFLDLVLFCRFNKKAEDE